MRKISRFGSGDCEKSIDIIDQGGDIKYFYINPNLLFLTYRFGFGLISNENENVIIVFREYIEIWLRM